MWLRFTERARKVVFYAQEEAQKFGEGYVSTEHLLLGLVREPDSVAARVLEKMGVSLSRVRAEVEKQLPCGEHKPAQDMTLTPRAKRVIDLAYDEARNLNNNYIGTEHLLLGLIREGDGLAGRVLAKLGVELERTREEVREVQEEATQKVLSERPRSWFSMPWRRHKERGKAYKTVLEYPLCVRESSVLLVVDIQDKLLNQIAKGEVLLQCTCFLVECAQALEVPILVTEQNPEKLGSTTAKLAEVLSGAPRFAKLCFSCIGCSDLMKELSGLQREQVVLTGIETHICISQTAIGFLENGYDVFVCSDAVGARLEDAHEIAMARMRRLGVQITHTESVVYEWLREAGTDEFRKVLEILKRY